MPVRKNQITLGEYLDRQDKKGKRKFRPALFPWPVVLIMAIPLLIFISLLAGYILYIRRFAPHP